MASSGSCAFLPADPICFMDLLFSSPTGSTAVPMASDSGKTSRIPSPSDCPRGWASSGALPWAMNVPDTVFVWPTPSLPCQFSSSPFSFVPAGAGLFVDRILVTEDNDDEEEEKEDGGQEDEQYTQQMEETSSVPDCRQFLFLCSKWFDSGQVDGKLERTVRLSAFSEIGSIPVDGRVTRKLRGMSGTESAVDNQSQGVVGSWCCTGAPKGGRAPPAHSWRSPAMAPGDKRPQRDCTTRRWPRSPRRH